MVWVSAGTGGEGFGKLGVGFSRRRKERRDEASKTKGREGLKGRYEREGFSRAHAPARRDAGVGGGNGAKN